MCNSLWSILELVYEHTKNDKLVCGHTYNDILMVSVAIRMGRYMYERSEGDRLDSVSKIITYMWLTIIHQYY